MLYLSQTIAFFLLFSVANIEEKQKLNENKDKNNLQHLESDGILKGPGDGDVEGDSNSGYDR